MKTILVCLLLLGVLLFLYDRQHPFSRPSLPAGHEYAAAGVYFLRTAYTLNVPGGPVRWTQGQQLFADRNVKAPVPQDMIAVTDGTHSVQLPSNMLSQDVQEGEALRDLVIQNTNMELARAANEQARLDQVRMRQEARDDQDKERAALERAREAARAPGPTPTPKFGNTALDQPATRTKSRPVNPPNYITPYPSQ